jgi:hypothetical protein
VPDITDGWLAAILNSTEAEDSACTENAKRIGMSWDAWGGIIPTELRSLVEVKASQQLKFGLGRDSGGLSC